MEFTTEKVADGPIQRTEMPFKLDGEELVAYVPTDGQIEMAYRLTSRTATTADALQGSLDLLQGCLDLRSYHHIESRLLDPNDPFDLRTNVGAILEWLLRIWREQKTGEQTQSAAPPATSDDVTAKKAPVKKTTKAVIRARS